LVLHMALVTVARQAPAQVAGELYCARVLGALGISWLLS